MKKENILGKDYKKEADFLSYLNKIASIMNSIMEKGFLFKFIIS